MSTDKEESDIEFEKRMKKMEEYILFLRESRERKKKFNFPKIEITPEQIKKMNEQMIAEGRLFLPGHPDYEESLKHVWGTPKECWYIKPKNK